ncbi:protein kinase [Streptomyces sp. NPDC057682]|uniref:serine/threonine-protein kinase n=1 Tax=Streptomyces sp. NPDC057682 TaxID=3346210 RepID=UPI0036AACA3D
MRGEVLENRYRLVEKLGAGGMGQVWRAVDARLDRDVAVKVIAQNAPATGESAARFRQEARATARLTHPRIVTIHDHGEALVDGQQILFLVMELVPGRSMASFDAAERRSVETVVAWALQICAGLAAAHRAGVVHRDIKPANVMVYGDGEHDLKICDFGIARLVEESGAGLTGTGAAIGTPAYMSPEQVRGDRTLDGRSDLYSLGCLLYQLLVGRPPFEGVGWSVLAQHLNGTPEPVRSLRPDVPAALDRLVAALLHKDPDDRPATAEAVSARLRALPAGTVRDARPPAAGPVPPDALAFAGAPTADAPRSRDHTPGEPDMPPPRATGEPDTAPPPPRPRVAGDGDAVPSPEPVPPDAAPAARPATHAPSVPGSGRIASWDALLATGGLGAQFTLLTGWSVFWTVAVCVPVYLVALAAAFLGAPTVAADDRTDPDTGVAGMGVLCTVLATVFLLFWPPSPWWTALLAAVLGGPVLILSGMGIRMGVATVADRPDWQAAAASAAGLLNGLVLAGLLAAVTGLSAFASAAIGVGAWAAVALVIAVLQPRSWAAVGAGNGG